jgi:glycosyltransferase involved in cell wall biosynthesis
VELIIAGNGGRKEEILREHVKKKTNIIFGLITEEENKTIPRKLDFHKSLYQRFGLTMIEANSCGTPVVLRYPWIRHNKTW